MTPGGTSARPWLVSSRRGRTAPLGLRCASRRRAPHSCVGLQLSTRAKGRRCRRACRSSWARAGRRALCA
eukprot:15453646-Alexandrium_andersonii.AAC.1